MKNLCVRAATWASGVRGFPAEDGPRLDVVRASVGRHSFAVANAEEYLTLPEQTPSLPFSFLQGISSEGKEGKQKRLGHSTVPSVVNVIVSLSNCVFTQWVMWEQVGSRTRQISANGLFLFHSDCEHIRNRPILYLVRLRTLHKVRLF